jgi:hypothetical protein
MSGPARVLPFVQRRFRDGVPFTELGQTVGADAAETVTALATLATGLEALRDALLAMSQGRPVDTPQVLQFQRLARQLIDGPARPVRPVASDAVSRAANDALCATRARVPDLPCTEAVQTCSQSGRASECSIADTTTTP